MAWIYSAVSEGSGLRSSNGSSQSRIVNSIATVKRCSCPAWPAANYTRPPFGMMCGRCGGIYCPKWISSPGDFPARTSAMQEMAKAWKESEVDFSLKSSDWQVSYDHNSFSWKTSQLSLFGGLIEFSW